MFTFQIYFVLVLWEAQLFSMCVTMAFGSLPTLVLPHYIAFVLNYPLAHEMI